MPLSEQEQRLLEEMERSLYRNDADFVATVGARRGRVNYRAIVLGILLAVLGIGAMITGVALQLLVIGVIGFALMFTGVLLALAPGSKAMAAPGNSVPSAGHRPKSSSGFMDRMNQRWDRRQDGHD